MTTDSQEGGPQPYRSCRLMWATPDAELMMAKCARVSNPDNQDNPEFRRLFKYCLGNGHWSVFQMASMCVSVETSLAVAVQMMRHWSLAIHEPLDVQMLSQRYVDPMEKGLDYQHIELRKAAASNRQSSEEPLSPEEMFMAQEVVRQTLNQIDSARAVLKHFGVANECIRMIYPQATTTRFYVSGSCRSWIHYFAQRCDSHAQLEHRRLAGELLSIFAEVFPIVYDIQFNLKEPQ